MSRPIRIVLVVFGVTAGLFAVCVTAASVWAYRAGVVFVSVHEKTGGGARVRLPVPMIFVEAATLLAPMDQLPELPPEAASLSPMIGDILRELSACPDAVLVEVETPEEHVVIAKRNGRFAIEVIAEDADVSISLPARSMRTIARVVENVLVHEKRVQDSWRTPAQTENRDL
ncbi:MAG: hypothetical protein JXO72_14785 [Vicinamibacteria bacterium]|nr:hypothetical protein [Vicinamibacteria bacterium]